MGNASTPERVSKACDEVALLLRERHRLKPGQPDDFRMRNSAEFMSMMNSTSTVMTNLLLGVALISLIVGGVGIMNITYTPRIYGQAYMRSHRRDGIRHGTCTLCKSLSGKIF